MASIEIMSHILGDHFLVCLQQIKIFTPHFCGNLETDMEQLAKAAVVRIRTGVVPERGSELLGRPPSNFRRHRKSLWVDVNDCGIGLTQFFAMCIGLDINLLGECQALSPRFGEAYDLFEPSGSGSFKVNPRIALFQSGVNRWVDGKLVAARVYAEFQVAGQSVFPDGMSDCR